MPPILMESRDVFTQPELDQALAEPGAIPVCAGDGEFHVGGEHFVRAADSARVVARERAEVEAGGAATVVAVERAWVTARNAATVEASDSSVVTAGDHVTVRAAGRTRVVAAGHASVDGFDDVAVVAQGRAAVRAADRCVVRALLSARVELSGDSQGWVWGLASAQAADRARVTAWGTATVIATGSASVEALETATVVAGGSVSVRAFGAAMVRARGQLAVEAADGVAVMRHRQGTAEIGATAPIDTRPGTAAEWCRYYGVPVTDGVVVLYKAVDEEFDSYHGTSYRPGSLPAAPDWDGGERECGGGLHLSPRPTFALAAPEDDMRFVACPVRLEDIAVHPRPLYPDKVKARALCAPVYEVREDGTPVAG
jgi:hypothetical protein